MRLVLDMASTFAQAKELIENYNYSAISSAAKCSYHFLVGDASGAYSIIECSYGEDQNIETQ